MHDDTIRSLIRSLPKAEIHLHLEGLVSVDTIWTLINKHDLHLPGISTKEDLYTRFQVKSLDQFIDMFINIIQASFHSEDDFYLLMNDAEAYLLRNNIKHAEVFFAPTKFVKSGLSFAKIVTILNEKAQAIFSDYGISIHFLIDVSRGFGLDNAMKNLQMTLENMNPSIVGIGLGGAERVGPCKEFASVFKIAQENGLKTVAHAGEDVGPESVWQAIEDLNVSRIGHGISAIKDKRLMDYLKDTQIPLEISPTSNLFTRRYATTYKNHPIKAFLDHGINVTLNTDDPTLFNSELNHEYAILAEENIFTSDELIQILHNTIDATFLSNERKTDLWNSVLANL